MSGLGLGPGADEPQGHDGALEGPPWEPDAVPPAVRSGMYVAALILGALATAAVGLTTALFPQHVELVTAICGAVTGVVLTITGGLGVVYRPTR